MTKALRKSQRRKRKTYKIATKYSRLHTKRKKRSRRRTNVLSGVPARYKSAGCDCG